MEEAAGEGGAGAEEVAVGVGEVRDSKAGRAVAAHTREGARKGGETDTVAAVEAKEAGIEAPVGEGGGDAGGDGGDPGSGGVPVGGAVTGRSCEYFFAPH